MVKRGVTIQLNAEAEGSQRTQQRVDHSLSYTMKKKKDLINAECHHSIITQKNWGSNRPKGANLAFQVLGTGVGLGTAGLEQRAGLPFSHPMGPWGARSAGPATPPPTLTWWSSPGRKGKTSFCA